MRTLYVSDLDGTLLHSGGYLSGFSKKQLAFFAGRGVHLACATARSPITAPRVLDGAPFLASAILMNGALICGQGWNRYDKAFFIENRAALDVLETAERHGHEPFIYVMRGDAMYVAYRELKTPAMRQFYEIRKSFLAQDDFGFLNENPRIVYMIFVDARQRLLEAYEEMSKIEGVTCLLYRDTYAEYWFLEIFSREASKKNGALWIKRTMGFDRMIGFGDNLNDLSLFEACDEAYAVSNAVDELKKAATGVIGSCDEDAVVKKIMELEGL